MNKRSPRGDGKAVLAGRPRPAASAYAKAPAGLCLVDEDFRLTLVNEALAGLLETSSTALAGRRLDEVMPAATDFIAQLAPGKPITAFDVSDPTNGKTFQLSATRMDTGGYSVAVQDVTARQAALKALAESAERSSFALDSAGQWVWDFDITANRVWRSQQWKRTLGFLPEELGDEDEPWRIVHPADRRNIDMAMRGIMKGEKTSFEATYRLRHKDGSWRWILSRGTVVAFGADGAPARVLATSVDITRQKQTEQELEANIRQRKALEHDLLLANRRLKLLAEIDSLTELPNRRKFDKVLEREFRRVRRESPTMALLMIDVDYFKTFNDLYGHPAGDECLRAVAEALQQVIRDTKDIVTRYGGEEFAAIIVNTDQAGVRAIARRMVDAVRGLGIRHQGSPFGIVTICVGLTVFGLRNHPGSLTPQRLLQASDLALYAAKDAGRNRIALARIDADGRIETELADESASPETAQGTNAQ